MTPKYKIETTATIRERDHKTTILTVRLAENWKGFPMGTAIGRLQERQYFGKKKNRSDKNTFTENAGIMGWHPDWLVNQFLENQCGRRQARRDALQPGAEYTVNRMFGMLHHKHGIYEPGNRLKILTANETELTVETQRPNSAPEIENWNRSAMEGCVDTFAITKIPAVETAPAK